MHMNSLHFSLCQVEFASSLWYWQLVQICHSLETTYRSRVLSEFDSHMYSWYICMICLNFPKNIHLLVTWICRTEPVCNDSVFEETQTGSWLLCTVSWVPKIVNFHLWREIVIVPNNHLQCSRMKWFPQMELWFCTTPFRCSSARRA